MALVNSHLIEASTDVSSTIAPLPNFAGWQFAVALGAMLLVPAFLVIITISGGIFSYSMDFRPLGPYQGRAILVSLVVAVIVSLTSAAITQQVGDTIIWTGLIMVVWMCLIFAVCSVFPAEDDAKESQ